MKLWRAIRLGALSWILIFFEVSALMFGLKWVSGTLNYNLVHYTFLIVIVALCGYLYFRGKKIEAGWFEGLKVGLVFLVTGIVLDAAITVPLFVKSYAFFLDFNLIIGFIESVIVVMVVGAVMEK